MKTIIAAAYLVVHCIAVGEQPKVDIYLIRKMDLSDPATDTPEIVIEVSNPTERTFYTSGNLIENPIYHLEAIRKGRWLKVPRFICGTGHSTYPLRPGAKILTTVSIPWEEQTFRYRFFFWRTDKRDGDVVTVCTRAIVKKELGDLGGTIGELQSDEELEEPFEQKRKESDYDVVPDAEIDPFDNKANKSE